METALVAAFIAAGAAIVAAIVSWFGAFQSRRTADRDQAWKRLTWAMRPKSTSTEYDISRTVLERMLTVRWASKSDKNLALRALRRHTPPPPEEREP